VREDSSTLVPHLYLPHPRYSSWHPYKTLHPSIRFNWFFIYSTVGILLNPEILEHFSLQANFDISERYGAIMVQSWIFPPRYEFCSANPVLIKTLDTLLCSMGLECVKKYCCLGYWKLECLQSIPGLNIIWRCFTFLNEIYLISRNQLVISYNHHPYCNSKPTMLMLWVWLVLQQLIVDLDDMKRKRWPSVVNMHGVRRLTFCKWRNNPRILRIISVIDAEMIEEQCKFRK